MALGTGYERQGCYLARALEVVGERWTLLILRDAFYGVTHFGDFLAHLDVSRAVLADRLDTLVGAGVLTRSPQGRSVEYTLTDAGRELWPVIHRLSRWGEEHLDGNHPPRVFSHVACGTDVDADGACPTCRVTPPVEDLVVRLAPGRNAAERHDPVAVALKQPHRMLTPLP
ncbi:winged helix-turn-helix transcriptional regulator [Enemella evansiae]|uniref:ArsR family transcriptional regulator n=1 Tax=Enemella evansiae TaxID=2016499 RepID=A0A255GFN5_9ACTN|nr:helix-turn-helix domain-containing protein [Enemella evansiae]OYO08515.1 ArsR family transcriptional regulator [Enemella evansiae]OYO14657.1 ArsR family transcriptional regulator [Enemella evansiae]TDO93710.1 HxlR family transcriptional regulator [Enemella evansiae]